MWMGLGGGAHNRRGQTEAHVTIISYRRHRGGSDLKLCQIQRPSPRVPSPLQSDWTYATYFWKENHCHGETSSPIEEGQPRPSACQQ